eukprot:TRINITY_DN3471_c7_g1_i1.p1 TRINITY_DN3471_c7_g1~~TRINITY_DN3471_c7_g1_i1.p1  ORF type:complete len:473 (-),score=145.05 TRINITY_DN3471_c7_g1_i1:56-1474(-)
MELTTALIWTLRIVLPIVLFIIYFKLQSPSKEEQAYQPQPSFEQPSSTKDRYVRSQLLTARKAIPASEPVPEELATIALKDQTQAPALFTGKGGGRGERGSRREDGGRRDKGERKERREREPRDREKKEAREKRPKDRDASIPQPQSPAAASPSSGVNQPLSEEEEKKTLESLLNYVAFNKKEQQRTFLVDGEDAPPPPPKPGAPAELESAGPVPMITAGLSAEKANEEAQMVLRGAINFKRSDVAKDLYSQLEVQKIDVSDLTYTLMIEACIHTQDLKSASDFLMKMESSGHSPSSELLDKVMDLYAQQKTKKEQAKQMQNADFGDYFMQQTDAPRVKLRTDAAIFVPSFGIPPPPPKKDKDSSAEVDQGSAEAPAATDSAEAEAPRTRLRAAANVFQPQFTPGEANMWPDTGDMSYQNWDAKNGKGKSHGGGKDNNGRDSQKGRGKGSSGESKGDGNSSAAKKGTWKLKE